MIQGISGFNRETKERDTPTVNIDVGRSCPVRTDSSQTLRARPDRPGSWGQTKNAYGPDRIDARKTKYREKRDVFKDRCVPGVPGDFPTRNSHLSSLFCIPVIFVISRQQVGNFSGNYQEWFISSPNLKFCHTESLISEDLCHLKGKFSGY